MIGRLRHELRLFFIGLQFLTRVPVPRWVGFEPAWLQQSARHFPAVGLCVGAVGAGVLVMAQPWTGPAVAAVLSTISTVALTGGFHEDGLADTCDGLGGHVSRERAMEIMKDSRIGSYGALGLVLALALKLSLLLTLSAASAWSAAGALWLAHAVSRTGAVALIAALPYAGDVGAAKAKPLAQTLSGRGLGVAVGWVLMAAAALAVMRPAWAVGVVAAVGAAALCTWACGRLWRRRLGGFTGDTLGATQQLAELAALLGWLMAMQAVVRFA